MTHFGKCIDEKTPLLRSMDAVKLSGLRLLKAIQIGTEAQSMHSYLGWEQDGVMLELKIFTQSLLKGVEGSVSRSSL